MPSVGALKEKYGTPRLSESNNFTSLNFKASGIINGELDETYNQEANLGTTVYEYHPDNILSEHDNEVNLDISHDTGDVYGYLNHEELMENIELYKVESKKTVEDIVRSKCSDVKHRFAHSLSNISIQKLSIQQQSDREMGDCCEPKKHGMPFMGAEFSVAENILDFIERSFVLVKISIKKHNWFQG